MKVLVIFCVALAAAWEMPPPLLRPVRTVAPSGAEQSEPSQSPDGSRGAQYFCQQLKDHLDPQDGTWCMLYFVNAAYWKPGGPVFLCTGGEGPSTQSWLEPGGSSHCNDAVEMAPRFGAMLFAPQHRFYAKNAPVANYSTPNLRRYLNSRQALADVELWRAEMVRKHRLRKSAWIAFGGSYPGTLSSWLRLLYPHSFRAAVASSAPVKAVADYAGYFDVAAADLALPTIGGSTQCAANVALGHGQIRAAFLQGDSRALEQMFNICPGSLDGPESMAMWAGSGAIGIPTQSNDPACTGPLCNIAKICAAMLEATVAFRRANVTRPEMHALAKISSEQMAGFGCMGLNYTEAVEFNKNTSIEAWGGPGGRPFMWQVCSEFGWHGTCMDQSNCPYTMGYNTVDFFYKMCFDIFGLTSDEVEAGIARTNAYFGSNRPNSTRVLWVNGEVDPWSNISVITSSSAQLPTVWVLQAAHHFWTRPVKGTDSSYVNMTRQKTLEYVAEWVGSQRRGHSAHFLAVRRHAEAHSEETDDSAYLQSAYEL